MDIIALLPFLPFLIILLIAMVDRTRFFIWLAVANIMTAVNCYVTAKFLGLGITLVFAVALLWWHFIRKRFIR